MEIESPDAKVPRHSMMVIVLGILVLDVLIAGYVQVATSRWNVTLLVFVGLLLLDAVLVVSFLRRKPVRHEGSQE
ncbi:MAG TPA: hypothetical protein VGG05_02610 [Pseudonocardiaceae bacterium]|jgi:membrane protein implicated in regulation of membrane protease activity